VPDALNLSDAAIPEQVLALDWLPNTLNSTPAKVELNVPGAGDEEAGRLQKPLAFPVIA
jgi:hypothetical protein